MAYFRLKAHGGLVATVVIESASAEDVFLETQVLEDTMPEVVGEFYCNSIEDGIVEIEAPGADDFFISAKMITMLSEE